MWTFIAGASTSGASVANAVVDSRSSARPQASFAMVLAVAGTIAKTSASSASETWWTCASASSHRPTATGSPVSARNVVGPTNRVADSVITTLTRQPARIRARAISHAL